MTDSRRLIFVAMIDGFGADYLDASEMPVLRRLMASGAHRTVDACMPTVTNVNNASICTGTWASTHGITANSWFDLATREEHYMDRGDMLLAPTLFQRAAASGLKSALLTAKVKTIRLLAAGADVTLAAEKPDHAWVERLGPRPDIYSADINYWLFDAARWVVTHRPDIDVVYCHTTDYPMHMSDPAGELSQRHLAELDHRLGRLIDVRPDLELYLTADHGMSFKRRCHDLNRLLPERGCPIYFAMSAERDPYVKHHRTFGGSAYLWLNDAADAGRVRETLLRVEGVEAVHDRHEAAARFHLHPERIGDLVVLGDRDTVFGPLDRPTEDLPPEFRTHGSLHECRVPLIVSGVSTARGHWQAYTHNVDLTRAVDLPRATMATSDV